MENFLQQLFPSFQLPPGGGAFPPKPKLRKSQKIQKGAVAVAVVVVAKKKLKKVQWQQQWERLSRPQWGELSPLEREEPTFGDRNSRFNNETNEHIFAPFHEKSCFPILFMLFLATLVALHFTPVSESVSKWVVVSD